MPKSANPDAVTQTTVMSNLQMMPMYFIENRGQVDSTIRYYSHANGGSVYLSDDGMITQYVQYDRDRMSSNQLNGLTPRHQFEQDTTTIHVRGVNLLMKMIGNNKSALMLPLNELPGKMNYFQGNNTTQWRTNVPIFKQVQYQDVYPGIDWVIKGTGNNLEYDFIVYPGAKPESIEFEIQGADKLEITPEGDLAIYTPLGICLQKKPKTYQVNSRGIQSEVASGFVLTNSQQVAFQVPAYDITKPLIIDPLVYATYLGVAGRYMGGGIALDSTGNVYVTGETISPEFPITPGSFDTSFNGVGAEVGDVFITKFNTSCSELIYSTFIGGYDADKSKAIAVDNNGNAYITGYTLSSTFPVTVGAFETTRNRQSVYVRKSDAFVVKLNPSGSDLVYSTYLGGSYSDDAFSIAIDSAGNAYVAGWTKSSTDFPTTAGAYDTTFNSLTFNDIFVTKVNPSGSGLIYSTLFGGSQSNWAYSIAVDEDGNAYITGDTESPDFPTTEGAFDRTFSCSTIQNSYGIYSSNGFVTKINPSGSALVYSTFLGDRVYDSGESIVVDREGNAFVTGYTYSTGGSDLSITTGEYDKNHNSAINDVPMEVMFITKMNPSGSGLVYSRILGGSGYSDGQSIAVDNNGNAYITGFTISTGYPVTFGAYDTTYNGAGDAFITKINPSGSRLLYSTYLGGGALDIGHSLVVDNNGDAYVMGWTQSSTNFPITQEAYDTTYNPTESYNFFLAKLSCSLEQSSTLLFFQSFAEDKIISLDWSNPTTSDYAMTLIRRRSDTFPSSPSEGTQSYYDNGNAYVDTNVINGVTYYYTAFAQNTLNEYVSAASTFATPKYIKNIKDISLIPGDKYIKLTWSNPTGNDYYATRVVRRSDRYPTGPDDGTTIYWFNGTVCVDTGLVNGKMYYYGLYAHDTSYSYAKGINASLTLIWNPEKGLFTNASDTAFWAFQKPGSVNQIASVSWLTSYNGRTGVLKVSYSDLSEGIKITGIPRIDISESSYYWYRLRVQYASDSPNDGHEIISQLLSYPDHQSTKIILVGGNWTGNGQIAPLQWYTFDAYVFAAKTSQQVQLILKNNGSAGDFYIDSIQCDTTWPPAFMHSAWSEATIGDFDTAADTTHWAFQAPEDSPNGMGTFSWVSAIGGRTGVLAVDFNQVQQGVKMTGIPTYAIDSHRNVLIYFWFCSSLSNATDLTVLGYLYAENDVSTFKVDLSGRGVLGDYLGTQWNGASLALTSVSENTSFRVQLVVKNNSQSPETVYLDNVTVICSSPVSGASPWAELIDEPIVLENSHRKP